MRVYDLALKRRSIRCFQSKKVSFNVLKKLLNVARLAPSAANLQPCEFIIVDKKAIVARIYPALRWAGYIRPEGDPPRGKRPVAYLVILIDQRKHSRYADADAAAAVENILLVAQDIGLGSCWLGAIDKREISRILNIPQYCEVKYVVALGYPAEEPKLEEMDNCVKYWKDAKGILHVPKRRLKEILHRNRF